MDNNVVSFEEKRKYLLRDKVLVESTFSVTATENKIMYCILQNAQVRRSEEVHCEISVNEFYKVLSKNEHKTPKYVKQCLEKLMTVQYRFWNDKKEGCYKLISGYTRDKETQIFRISVPGEIHKRIMHQDVYSPLDLHILTTLRSYYSQKLYEILRLWSRFDEEITVTFTVDYLRFLLDVEEVCKHFKNLNQYIKRCVKEIESKTNMRIKHEKIKEGSKVTKLKFTILDKDIRIFSNSKQDNKIEKDEKLDTQNENKEVDYKKYLSQTMTASAIKLFNDDFAKYDLDNDMVYELYVQSCEATLSTLKAKKIGKGQYSYFKEVFQSRLIPLDRYGIGLKVECM